MIVHKIAVLLLMLITLKSTACECEKTRGVEASEAIFIGTVIGIRNIQDSFDVYEIEFRVVKWRKGAQRPTHIKVYETTRYPSAGRFPVDIDAVYEVFTYAGPKGHLLTDGCCDYHKITDVAYLYEWDYADSVADPGKGVAMLKGRVTDISGNSIEGAKAILHIIQGRHESERNVYPGMSGHYVFPALDSGEYHLLVTAAGYQSQHIIDIRADKQVIVLNIALSKDGPGHTDTVTRRYKQQPSKHRKR